jgi:hypothetical protein
MLDHICGGSPIQPSCVVGYGTCVCVHIVYYVCTIMILFNEAILRMYKSCVIIYVYICIYIYMLIVLTMLNVLKLMILFKYFLCIRKSVFHYS